MLCNNLSESFNSFILRARDKPIITMLEMIRRLYIDRIKQNRRIAMERTPNNVCPRIVKLLDNWYEHSRNMEIRWNGGDDFEVNAYRTIFNVNVRRRECSCRLWQLTGLPCAHPIHCINHKGLTSIDLVDECYNKSLFLDTYSNVLFPTTSSHFWVNTNEFPLAPPNYARLVGRPKKSRHTSADEVSQRGGVGKTTRRAPTRCSICASFFLIIVGLVHKTRVMKPRVLEGEEAEKEKEEEEVVLEEGVVAEPFKMKMKVLGMRVTRNDPNHHTRGRARSNTTWKGLVNL